MGKEGGIGEVNAKGRYRPVVKEVIYKGIIRDLK